MTFRILVSQKAFRPARPGCAWASHTAFPELSSVLGPHSPAEGPEGMRVERGDNLHTIYQASHSQVTLLGLEEQDRDCTEFCSH